MGFRAVPYRRFVGAISAKAAIVELIFPVEAFDSSRFFFSDFWIFPTCLKWPYLMGLPLGNWPLPPEIGRWVARG